MKLHIIMKISSPKGGRCSAETELKIRRKKDEKENCSSIDGVCHVSVSAGRLR